VIAKTSPDRLGTYAQERGWRNLRLLSSRNNTFNRDYHAEAPDGGQLPVLNLAQWWWIPSSSRENTEMTFKRGDTSSLDPVWPIYGALDLTREGRGQPDPVEPVPALHIRSLDGADASGPSVVSVC
jgi:predicted dithiol-disulfide oxidoreductase (DUF899 family)